MAKKEKVEVKEEVEIKDRVEADELASIMGGEMSEKEKERKRLFEGDKEKDTDEDKDKDKSEEGEKDDEKGDEEDGDKEELKEDEDEEKKDEDGEKKDDDVGDDKDSDKDKDEEVDERQALTDEVEALRKTINEMLTPLKVKKEEDEDEDEGEEKKEETRLEKKGKDYVFITQKELDGEEFVVDAKFLNEFGNRIANQVKKDSLTSTAKIVKSHISETQKFRDLASDFYSDNPDLNERKIKAFVGYRVSVLANEHPDWDYEKLFSKLGKDVREKLGLKAQAEKIEKKRKDKPAFVKKSKGKSKTGKEEVTGTLKEIGELISKQ